LIQYFSENTPWSLSQNNPPPINIDPWLYMAYTKVSALPLDTLCGNISPLGRPQPFYKRPAKALWFSLAASLFIAILPPLFYLISFMLSHLQSNHIQHQITLSQQELDALQTQHTPSKEASQILTNDTQVLDENLKQQKNGLSHFLEAHEKSDILQKIEPFFTHIALSEAHLKKITVTSDVLVLHLVASSPLPLSLLHKKFSLLSTPATPFAITKDEKENTFVTTLSLKETP
jgi:hypothetical protein